MEPIAQTDRDEGIQVLRRAAAALDEIAAEPGQLRLVDLGERLGLAKSTARRLLVGLVEVGLASVDSQGQFLAGRAPAGIRAAPTERTSPPSSGRRSSGWRARPTARRSTCRYCVASECGSSTRSNRRTACGRSRRSASGSRWTATANGKAALAALDDAEAQAALARFGPEVADGLRREIAEIRRTGIAFDRDEHTPGISAAAIARRALGDNVVAISVPAPTERFLEKEQRIVSALRAAAESPAWTR